VISETARPIVVAAIWGVVVAVAGALLTDIGPWYQLLRVPRWKPPDWAFGPVWTLIFTLAATAGVYAWRSAPTVADRQWLLALFAANGALNILWSLLFFRLRRPDWALYEVPFLWLSVLAMIVVMSRYCRPALWLLLPYLVWVSVASVLNATIVKMNGPFQGH
jgi:tryptophan-rich sensory protein